MVLEKKGGIESAAPAIHPGGTGAGGGPGSPGTCRDRNSALRSSPAACATARGTTSSSRESPQQRAGSCILPLSLSLSLSSSSSRYSIASLPWMSLLLSALCPEGAQLPPASSLEEPRCCTAPSGFHKGAVGICPHKSPSRSWGSSECSNCSGRRERLFVISPTGSTRLSGDFSHSTLHHC